MGHYIPPFQRNSIAKGWANIDTKQQDIPTVVNVRFITEFSIVRRVIRLSSDWAKEIVVRTWEGDISAPRDFIAPLEVYEVTSASATKVLNVLAHISARTAVKPCSECTESCILKECKVNAIWPISGACTCCAFQKKEDKCSFNKGMKPIPQFSFADFSG
ncbi:hypothetical protein KEM56_000438 [Ascosphaera pollenicola]|nr:hypothetical protein KEM56_000438 [Ascosphaera pollenicola]